jgi:hypothetical protein
MFKIFRKSKPIYKQVLLFAGTLLSNEKIIVSNKIIRIAYATKQKQLFLPNKDSSNSRN